MGGAPAREGRERGEHRKPGILAFLGVELGAVDVAVLHGHRYLAAAEADGAATSDGVRHSRT